VILNDGGDQSVQLFEIELKILIVRLRVVLRVALHDFPSTLCRRCCAEPNEKARSAFTGGLEKRSTAKSVCLLASPHGMRVMMVDSVMVPGRKHESLV
jgi:hypothetical protein